MAQATRRRGAGGQTARREGWQAHRRTGRDRAAHPRTRSRKQAVAHHRGRPGHHGKSTRSLGVTVRESGLRRAAQEALTETFAMLTGHGVSTRQAATLTGLVRSTATRRRHAATALTPAVSTEPAVEPANKLTDLERRRVLEVLTSDRFVDLAPLQIYAQLLDEGVYLCSVSTMYRCCGRTRWSPNAAGWRGTRRRCARSWSRPRRGKCIRGTSPSSRARSRAPTSMRT